MCEPISKQIVPGLVCEMLDDTAKNWLCVQIVAVHRGTALAWEIGSDNYWHSDKLSDFRLCLSKEAHIVYMSNIIHSVEGAEGTINDLTLGTLYDCGLRLVGTPV